MHEHRNIIVFYSVMIIGGLKNDCPSAGRLLA